MAGPSFSGPLTGWSSTTVAPKVVAPPVAANTSDFRPQPIGSGPGSPFDYKTYEQAAAGGDYDNSPEANQARLAKAAAAEAAARASGDPYQLRLAQSMLTGFTAQSTPGDAKAKRDAAMVAEKAFITRNPTAVARVSPLSDKPGMAGLKEMILGSGSGGLRGQTITAEPKSASSSDGGSGGGSSDVLGPDARVAKKPMTPLESLLSSIYPEEAQAAAADPMADPRAVGSSPSVIDTILGNLGASRGVSSSGSAYVPGPAFSGPAVGPSQGANIAATIPGAPAFLSGAINGVQAFNPYNQVPMQPARGGGGGFDPLIGISAISAEQRVQKAELDKARAAANAKYHASQVKQEKMRAESANLARLKGTGAGGSGWSGPAMPTY